MTHAERFKRRQILLNHIRLLPKKTAEAIEELAERFNICGEYARRLAVVNGIVVEKFKAKRPLNPERDLVCEKRVWSIKKAFEMVQLKLDNPTMTLQEIGDRCGCTRERVRQVLDVAREFHFFQEKFSLPPCKPSADGLDSGHGVASEQSSPN